MDNHDSQENLDHNASRYPNINNNNNNNNNIDVNSEKTISLDSNDVRIYRMDGADENNRLTNVSNNDASLNPFAAALDVWQNYVRSWSNAYNHLFFKNPPMTNGEFWFMYCRFDSKSNEKVGEK
jgi:hypothetical protein